MSTIAQTTAADRALHLEALAKQYRDARAVLEERVQALEDEVAAAHRRKLPGIKTALAKALEAKDALTNGIDENRDVFAKPKTHTAHATRYGLMKGKGRLEWDDDDTVVDRIERTLPEQAADLIRTTKKPDRKALEDLDAKTLRRLGVTVEDTDDVPFVKAIDGDATKMVKRLLKESTGRIPEEE